MNVLIFKKSPIPTKTEDGLLMQCLIQQCCKTIFACFYIALIIQKFAQNINKKKQLFLHDNHRIL